MSKFLVLGMLCATALAVEKPGDDPLQWLRDSIPGEPGVDYPIYSSVDSPSFSCEGKIFGGYYADPAFQCQAYHVCLLDPITNSMYPTSFLCPNGTLFQQEIFNCDWWYNVDCSQAESLYGLAENAFGNDGGATNGVNGGAGGQCPNVNPLSDAECAGTVSNCWSPGQPDTDCPNFGLCCFDGCANTCVEGFSDARPAPQTTPRPVPQTTPRPVPQTTPRPAPVTTRAPTVTTGYDYPVPDVSLPIRPVTTPAPVITTPSALYGAPPPGAPGGAPRRNGRRGKRQGKVRYVFV